MFRSSALFFEGGERVCFYMELCMHADRATHDLIPLTSRAYPLCINLMRVCSLLGLVHVAAGGGVLATLVWYTGFGWRVWTE